MKVSIVRLLVAGLALSALQGCVEIATTQKGTSDQEGASVSVTPPPPERETEIVKIAYERSGGYPAPAGYRNGIVVKIVIDHNLQDFSYQAWEHVSGSSKLRELCYPRNAGRLQWGLLDQNIGRMSLGVQESAPVDIGIGKVTFTDEQGLSVTNILSSSEIYNKQMVLKDSGPFENQMKALADIPCPIP